jgi:GNAT superfamily N-acetyltransferase/catechol 2,3-dioxygenase-like lactoylglutathione lyase family enzyme
MTTAAPASPDESGAIEALAPPNLRNESFSARLRAAVDNGEVLVVRDGTEIAGFAWIQPHGFFGHAFVNLLVVAAPHRRRGYATALMRQAQIYATTDRIVTSTNRSNEAMHSLCRRNGWHRCGEVDAVDAGDPEVFYVKWLANRTMPAAPIVQHVRIARPTQRLGDVVAFYRDIVGLDVLAEFRDHDGFDGAMLGQRGAGVHFEFTHEHGGAPLPEASPEALVVLYFDEDDWRAMTQRLDAGGVRGVASRNPYWDRHGVTLEDPDGYRVVLHRGPWRER